MHLLSKVVKGKYVVLKRTDEDRKDWQKLLKSWKSYTCFSADYLNEWHSEEYLFWFSWTFFCIMVHLYPRPLFLTKDQRNNRWDRGHFDPPDVRRLRQGRSFNIHITHITATFCRTRTEGHRYTVESLKCIYHKVYIFSDSVATLSAEIRLKCLKF